MNNAVILLNSLLEIYTYVKNVIKYSSLTLDIVVNALKAKDLEHKLI